MKSLTSCFCLSKSKNSPGFEEHAILASETIFNVNEVEALHILFEQLSNSVIRDGRIHKEEFLLAIFDSTSKKNLLAERLKEMVMATLNESELWLSDVDVDAIVNKTFQEVDLKQDGRIDREEWKQMVAKYPSLIKNMTLPYLREVTLAFPNFIMETEVPDSELVF